jgi:AcrR family transcriptional regulator
MRVVSKRGPERMTLADVGAEIGLAPSTLAERFGSKRDLLLAASRASAAGVDRAFAAAEGGARLAALVDALARLARSVKTRPAFANHLAVLELDVADPDFRQVAAEHASALRAAVEASLHDAVAARELPRTTDVPRLARAVHVAYNGSLVTWAVGGSGALEAALRADLYAVLGYASGSRGRSGSRA